MDKPPTRGFALATNAVSTVFVANLRWDFALLHNVSDTTVYVQFTNEEAELTPENGMPLLAGKELSLRYPPGRRSAAPLKIIIAGAGSKEIRWAVA